jgi:hypothetical protein
MKHADSLTFTLEISFSNLSNIKKGGYFVPIWDYDFFLSYAYVNLLHE